MQDQEGREQLQLAPGAVLEGWGRLPGSDHESDPIKVIRPLFPISRRKMDVCSSVSEDYGN